MKEYISGGIAPVLMVGTIIIGFMSFVGVLINPTSTVVDMRIEPTQGLVGIDENFSIDLVVESNIEVNVFAGDIYFNAEVLRVVSIDYNTSIANLWAKKPWYSNGDGIINFAGGTTNPGGFTGTGSLLKITFQTIAPGKGSINIDNARILIHDGLGTDATIEEPIDSIFTVAEPNKTQEILFVSGTKSNYLVMENPPQTDLNKDGQQSMKDISIFMVHLASQNDSSDFNNDGSVNISDLSILMNAK